MIRIAKCSKEYNEKANKLLRTEKGIVLRMNRSIQVEGAFGVIKQNYGFRRFLFLMRGKRKTELQFFLMAMAYNVQKLINHQENGRFNREIYEKYIA